MINLITDLISFTQPTNLDRESLSVIESIAKIKKVVNECITQFNNLENKTDEDYNNFLKQIKDYKNYIENLCKHYRDETLEIIQEFKDLIRALENIEETIEWIKKQSEFVQDLAKQNQDAIDKGTIVTKDEINKINTSLVKKINYSNRLYKPRFERVIQTAYVDNNYNSTLKKTHDEIKTELENMKNSGVEYLQLVFPIGIKTSDGSNNLFVSATDDNYKDTYDYIVSVCNNIGLKISTLKIHCHETNRVLTLERIKNTCGVESFKTQYLNLIKEIYNNYKTYTNKVIILNEQDYFYLGSSHVDFCINCIIELQNLGAKVSISTIQPFAINKMDSTVIDNLDFLSSNYYPPLSRNGLNASYPSMVNRMVNANDYKYGIIKMLSYNKPIYISEFGGQDIEESLDKPWIWSFTDDTTKGGKVQNLFLNIIIDLLNDNRIDGLAYWWELDTSLNNKIHKMTGVVDNE